MTATLICGPDRGMTGAVRKAVPGFGGRVSVLWENGRTETVHLNDLWIRWS